MAKNEFIHGALVEDSSGRRAIITGVEPYNEHYRLRLNFLDKQPDIYYCISDSYKVVAPASSLMRELF